MGNLTEKITIEEQRQQFLGLANKTYFNFGGQGTMPQASLDAIVNTHQYIQKVGPFSGQINSWLQSETALLRKAIAEELKTTADRITLTENVTAGCNIALWGIQWQPGDRILMTDCEHPGIIATVNEIARRFAVKVEICPILDTLNQGDPVAVIQQYLTPETRLVVISHLLWNTGQVLPLKEIVTACHSYSHSKQQVKVLVDAAQSVGSLDLNLPESAVDYYAFTGHKWLCGPAGVGGLYVSESAFAELHPTFIGWRGVDIDTQGQPQNWKSDGQKYEVATSAYPEYQGLQAAISIHQQWGTSTQRYQRIRQLSQYLWFALTQLPEVSCLKKSPPEAGLVSFQIPDKNHLQIVNHLETQGFFLRTIAYPDCIRACVHYMSLTQEIDSLVAAISLAISQV
ncbi:Selenocysteine lyase [Hyella patelloides LEGE 07179]|uniref:Selenocysteine lyase n=1 Tax=Hyella patelloides LEGE 07179 TaxID=945734 RepID=A0A563VPW5_9CYAN|nr:aminotransferase class V-fold PLP-dependent enzyme [Hyella patelloides]VEP13506.1 Selenocysteine lyase [Hyella patelloides LEGE 07179]